MVYEKENEQLQHDILTEQHAMFMVLRKKRLRKQEEIRAVMLLATILFGFSGILSIISFDLVFLLASFAMAYLFYSGFKSASIKISNIKAGKPESISDD